MLYYILKLVIFGVQVEWKDVYVFVHLWGRYDESESSYATESTRQSGRWPGGGSGRHRPHNSLIMPLQGNSKLLMAFCTARGDREASGALKWLFWGITAIRTQKSNFVQKHVFSRQVKTHALKKRPFLHGGDKLPHYQTLLRWEGYVGLSAV